MRERAEPAPPQVPAPRGLPAVPALLPLQQTIGNRAVARLVRSRRQVSRDDTHKAPLPLAPPTGAPYVPSQKLTARDREILEAAAGHRVDQAFTAFSHAVKDHAASIKSEEKFKAEILAATLDIFFGLAAPFFAQQLMARLPGAAKLAKKLGEKLSNAGVEGVKAVSDADILKESFKAVGKAATSTIKIEASALFGETDVDAFAKQLNDAFHAGAQAITDALSRHQLTDDELIATWAAYDVEYTSETAYTVALKQLFSAFKTFVRPIGVNHPSDALGGTATTTTARVVWVSTPQGGRRLMLWEEHSSANAGAELESRSLSEVPADIASFAVAKTIEEFGSIETLSMPWDPPAAPDPDSEPEVIRRSVEEIQALKRRLDEAERRRRQQQVTDFIEQHPEWQVRSGSSTPRGR